MAAAERDPRDHSLSGVIHPLFLQTPLKDIASLLSSCTATSMGKSHELPPRTTNKEVERGKKETAKHPGKKRGSGIQREEKEENHMAGKVEIQRERFRKEQDIEIKQQLK